MSCGSHSATDCNRCPVNGDSFMGASWCNGDCHWKDDECIPSIGRKKNKHYNPYATTSKTFFVAIMEILPSPI